MQPLNAIASPRSESIIGCCEVGERSRMLRRRWPSEIVPCEKKPPASGPLSCIVSAIFWMDARLGWPSNRTSPHNPHIVQTASADAQSFYFQASDIGTAFPQNCPSSPWPVPSDGMRRAPHELFRTVATSEQRMRSLHKGGIGGCHDQQHDPA